jgi:hypothetical protein
MSKIYYIGSTINQLPVQPQNQVGFLRMRRTKKMLKNHWANRRQMVQKPIPGVLSLPADIGGMSEGHLDLLLAKQRAEIEMMNSAAVAGPDNFQINHYKAAIAAIDHCLANVNNGDAICGIGEELIGKAKKKGGKTAAGRFLQKIGKGIKKGVKAITKVVTLPLRMLAKGAMEIYLPKAAPAFLYLFAEENILPDKMRIKRKKAEKFKNFVVKKIGMKDKHFMAIIRNNLTKRYGQSPENYLAARLKQAAVKGIGTTHGARIRVNPQWAGVGNDSSESFRAAPQLAPHMAPNVNVPAASTRGRGTQKILAAGKKFAQGDLIGAIMGAIGWLISKLGGKKEGVSLEASDLPDIDADSGNAFKYEDLQQNYNQLNDTQRYTVKDVAADLIERNLDGSNVVNQIRQKLPFLNQAQQLEIAEEVREGFEPITEYDSIQLGRRIKQNVIDPTGEDLNKLERTGGGATGGLCSC